MLECALTFSIRASSYKRNFMIFYIDTQRWSKQPVTNARRHPIAMPHRRGDKLTATPQDLWYQHLRLCQSTSSSILADARPLACIFVDGLHFGAVALGYNSLSSRGYTESYAAAASGSSAALNPIRPSRFSYILSVWIFCGL